MYKARISTDYGEETISAKSQLELASKISRQFQGIYVDGGVVSVESSSSNSINFSVTEDDDYESTVEVFISSNDQGFDIDSIKDEIIDNLGGLKMGGEVNRELFDF